MTDAAGVMPLDEDDPTAVGPYTLLGRLGDGGMGSVYLARHITKNSAANEQPLVAVKVIRADLARIPEFRERFLREAHAAQRVAQFCTAAVIEVGAASRRPYLVTEYIEGPTLTATIRRHGAMPPVDLERLAVTVASALTAIHAAGVVHRDLKPGNILLSSSGARVIDFGIALASDATTMMTQGAIGTPAFMAPEQALGEDVTAAADIFAWGSVLLFAATGRPPFGDGPMPVILQRVLSATPDFSSLHAGLLPLVERAMSKDPADRPTADELLLRLHRLRTVPGPVDVTRPPAATAASAVTTRSDGNPADLLPSRLPLERVVLDPSTPPPAPRVSAAAGNVAAGKPSDPTLARLLRERIVFLDSVIEDDVANRICAQLLLLYAEDQHGDIFLHIDSPGGSVSAGMAIYETMQYLENDVATVALGLAGGMAQVLLCAGAQGKRYALSKARVMTCPATSSSDAANRIVAEQIFYTRRTLQERMAFHTGQPLARIERDYDQTRWYTADEAMSYGMIDHVVSRPVPGTNKPT